MSLSKESLIEWAAAWIADAGQRQRFSEALADELKDWKPPPPKTIFCKNCPFAKHVHYIDEEENLVAPGCSGFEALP